MRTSVKFAAAWLGATILAVIVAATAVASVRSHVTDEPTQLGSPEVAALASDVPSPSAVAPTTTLQGVVETTTTTMAQTSSTTTTSLAVTTTTSSTSDSSPPSTAATTTTTPPTTQPPTTTTTQPPESYSKTFDTAGGSVRVVVAGDDVTFGGAVPNTGWSVELKKPGPDEVKVEFDRNEGEGEVEFSAKVENGELEVDISDEDHDD